MATEKFKVLTDRQIAGKAKGEVVELDTDQVQVQPLLDTGLIERVVEEAPAAADPAAGPQRPRKG